MLCSYLLSHSPAAGLPDSSLRVSFYRLQLHTYCRRRENVYHLPIYNSNFIHFLPLSNMPTLSQHVISDSDIKRYRGSRKYWLDSITENPQFQYINVYYCIYATKASCCYEAQVPKLRSRDQCRSGGHLVPGCSGTQGKNVLQFY